MAQPDAVWRQGDEVVIGLVSVLIGVVIITGFDGTVAAALVTPSP